MFKAVLSKELTQQQEGAFFTLLAREPGQETEEELESARTVLEALNGGDPEGKGYREACVALSLFSLYGGGREDFDRKEWERAFAALFPDRKGEAGKVEALAGAVVELKTVVSRDMPEKYENLKELCGTAEGWELICLMAKRAYLDVMMRMQDFHLVQGAVREVSGALLALENETRESVVALRNEFGNL